MSPMMMPRGKKIKNLGDDCPVVGIPLTVPLLGNWLAFLTYIKNGFKGDNTLCVILGLINMNGGL